ncbi:MAG: His-Xaa-Ser system radical SAM maturase HxsB [Candidatus Aenigmarchaeota archaeon]|nr:His-Xaa-Ser system radical SAM maturase HxsB [Candidatus Aenigmarchaeota archaeon]
MAISYFDYFGTEEYKINEYSYKKLDEESIFVSTVHGGWVVLSKEEFDIFRFGKLDKRPKLFKELEKNGLIVTGNNKENIVNVFKSRKSFLFNSVNLHIVSPTLRCNHKCVYCHAKSKPMSAKDFDMDEETAKDTVDFIFQSPSNWIGIEFQGGEPLVNFPIVKYIIEYAKKKNKKENKRLSFIAVTNLSLMDHDILKYLIKNNVGLCTSLDGPKELHDKNRKLIGKGSSYDTTVKWIEIIKNEYNYQISALPTTTKFSLDYSKEIVEEYVKQGFDVIRLRELNNAGFAQKLWEKIGYKPEEFLKHWKNVLDYVIELNRKGVDIKENMAVLLTKIFTMRNHPNYTCWGFPCGAALSQCAYDYKGGIYSCDEARSFEIFKIGNVKEHSYKEVFLSPEVGNIISASSGLMTKCSSCVWRPFCGSCLVCNYGQHGNIIGDMSTNNECKIRQGMLEYILKKIISPEERDILIKWSMLSKGI